VRTGKTTRSRADVHKRNIENLLSLLTAAVKIQSGRANERKNGRNILLLSSSPPFLHSIFIHDDAARRAGMEAVMKIRYEVLCVFFYSHPLFFSL
jgi:hypothetical protein